MTDAQTVDRDQLATDFRDAFANTLPQAVLDAALAHLESRPLIAGSNSAATLSLSGSINTRVKCTVVDGPTFLGHISGSTAGVTDQGYIYTDDSERLYSQSSTFTLVMTPVYASMVFMDDAGNALGSFQGGALGLVTGHFGGVGSWS